MWAQLWATGQFWAALLLWFAAQLSLQQRIWRLRPASRAALLSFALFALSCAGVSAWGRRLPSLYREFGVERCASYSQIGRRFKQWSRELHPDALAGRSPAAFSAATLLKEKLMSSAFRLFYDKFDEQLRLDELEPAQLSALYRFQIQAGILRYANTLFFWVFALFAASRLRGNFAAIGPLVKLLMGKSFAAVYYLFAQDVYGCSVVDRLCPRATIHQQLYLGEFVFAALLALAWPPLERRLATEELRHGAAVLALQRNPAVAADSRATKLRATLERYAEIFRLSKAPAAAAKR